VGEPSGKKMKKKTADAMRPIVELFAHYEGSKRAFCREHKLAIHTLDYWRRKFSAPRPKPSAFVAVELRDRPGGARMELYYPNGVRAVVPLEIPADILQKLIIAVYFGVSGSSSILVVNIIKSSPAGW
jgi:hypothetical protein